MRTIKTHIKQTFILALPISIGQLGHIMMSFVDSIMVGRLGAAPLAAAALINSLFFLIMVLGIGMTTAITPLVAIAKGAKKQGDCGKVLDNGFMINIVFSIIIILLMVLLSYLLKYFNQPPEVVKLGKSYLNILTISVLPFIIFQIYRQFLEGLSYVRPPMFVAIAANIFNALFNWLLIYGNLGFPAMGLDGAGWATTFTRVLMALALMIFTIKSPSMKAYNPGIKFSDWDKTIIKKLINIGLPSGVQYFLEIGAFSFAAIMMGWLGSIPLAAHQIAINLSAITYMIILGISTAGTIRVGNALGEKNIPEIRRAGFSAALVSTSIMLTFGIIFIIFRNFLPHIYIDENDVIELASKLIVVVAFYQIFDGIQATGIGILRGLTDVKIPMFIVFASYWIIAIPFSYVTGFVLDYGAIGIWIGLLIGLAVVAITLSIRFNILSKNPVFD
jgi:MATE family multidrug resistance protein